MQLKKIIQLTALVWLISGCASQYVAPEVRPTQERLAECMNEAQLDCAQGYGDPDSPEHRDCIQSRYDLILQAREPEWYAVAYPFGFANSKQEAALSQSDEKIVKPSQGSCFFLSPDGIVVTSHHVVEGKTHFQVIDYSGAKFSAALQKSDPSNDLAILRVQTQHNHDHLDIAPFGSIKTGQEVFAIGYPISAVLGTEVKFTDGAVSSTTGMQNMANMFQMTVPIQPGNSGGPVLNDAGQVVGVATSTAAVSTFLQYTGSLPQNVNWAVKSEYVSLLTGIAPTKVSWRSRQKAIDASTRASCMIRAE
jgi:S1-C subfamily serine protease